MSHTAKVGGSMEHFLYKIEKTLAMLFFALTCIFVLLGAVTRSVGYPLIWSVDMAQLMFAWTCAFAMDITLKHKGHVVIDIFAQHFPVKLKNILNMTWQILMMVFLALLIVLGAKLTLMDLNRVMGDTGLSYAFVNASIPIAALLMFITLSEQLYTRLFTKQQEA